MEFKTREREINLRTLIFSVLRSWRAMVIVALVLAIGLGAFQYYRTWNGINDPEKLALQQEEYKLALRDYERQRQSLQVTLENAERDRRELQDYLSNSLLMRLDPRNIYEAKLSLFVAEKTASDSGRTHAMVVAYENGLKDHDVISEIAATLELDTKYLQELITVSSGNGSDTQSHILSISVIYGDREGAEQIMDLLESKITEIGRDVRRNIGDHTVSVVADSIGIKVDSELAELQKSEAARLNEYSTAGENAKKELDSLRKPAEPALSTGAVFKNTLVYGVIGGVIGVFLVILVVCLAYIIGDRIHSGEEVKETFRIHLLGELSLREKPRKGIDKWLDHLEGKTSINQSVWQEMTAINARNFSAGMQTLLVVGSGDEDTVRRIAQLLQERLSDKTILVGGNLLTNASALEQLPTCEGVVLVEQCGASRFSLVARHVEIVENMRKPLVGAVILDY